MVHELRRSRRSISTACRAESPTVYGGGGSLTSCDDSIPDYHFEFKEAKRTGNTPRRPAGDSLHLKDIPVLWLPFFFSDTKNGRHSGILPPQFGVGDIVRNSPSYRRNVEHVGYYWALNDYMDFEHVARLAQRRRRDDRRSGLAQVQRRLELQMARPLSWRARRPRVHDAARRLDEQGDQLEPSAGFLARQPLQQQPQLRHEHDAAAAEHVQSVHGARDDLVAGDVSVQARSGVVLDRRDAEAVSRARAGRSDVSDAVAHVDGDRHRKLVDAGRQASASAAATCCTWISRASVATNSSRDRVRRARQCAVEKRAAPSNSSISFDTPLQIFGKDFKNSFRITQQRNNFAQQFPIYDVETGEITDTRVYAATYRTDIDWTPDFSLPPLAQQPVQSHAEPQPAERRSRAVLGRDRSARRPVRAPVQALHRSVSPRRRRCLACSAGSVRSSASATDHARPSATRTRRRRTSATNISVRSAERERATSAA